MKHLYKIIIIVTIVTTPVPTHAIVATLPLQVLQNVTALINNVTSQITAVTTTITQYATVAMKIKQFIDNPMMALFGANTGKQVEKEMRKWLATGLNGDPLLIKNPEAYLKNTQTNALRQQIAMIESGKNRSPWSESLVVSLIKQRRAEVNPNSAAIKDPTSSVVQDSLCSDNGAGLQRMLEQNGPIELGVAGGTEFDQKYNEYCTGDPSTDPDLQKKLVSISTSKNYFSWDSWLSTTVGGNNQYALKTKTQLEIQRRVQEQLALAQKEAEKGYLSDKKCIEYMKNDDDGNIYPEGTAPCIAYETKKPSDTVASIANQLDVNILLKPLFTAAQDKNLAKDALAGLGDVFKGIQEAVSTAQQIGSQIAQTGQAVQDLRGSINTLTGTIQYAGSALGGNEKGANQARINLLGTANTTYGSSASTYVGYNRSSISTTTQISDGSTPEQIESTVKPLRDLLTSHQLAMTKIPTTISKLDSYTDQYQNYIAGITSCTQSVKTSSGFNASSDQAFIDDIEAKLETKRKDVLAPILAPVTFAKSKTSRTNTYLSQTLTVVNNSKNISAVTLLFQEYKEAIANEIILPSDIDIQLDAILKKSSLDLQNDMNGVSDVVDNNSSIKALMNQCSDLLNQVNNRGGGGN